MSDKLQASQPSPWSAELKSGNSAPHQGWSCAPPARPTPLLQAPLTPPHPPPAYDRSSLVAPDSFTHILRVLNTNVDGKQKIMYALTAIRGLGRRFSNIAIKKAEVDLSKR